MGWATALVLLPVFALSLCFHVLLNKSIWKIVQEQRRQRAANPNPDFRRILVRNFGINAGIYSALGLAFFLGWLGGGVTGGVIATVGTLVGGFLVVLAFALKAAWAKPT